MEKTTCFLIDESTPDRENLTQLISGLNALEIIGNTSNLKEGLNSINELEPNILFIAVKGDGINTFKFIEKLKKQPTIIFLADADYVKTFESNKLNYLTKPVTAKDLSQLLNSVQKTHQQLANKMQSLLGKLKLED